MLCAMSSASLFMDTADHVLRESAIGLGLWRAGPVACDGTVGCAGCGIGNMVMKDRLEHLIVKALCQGITAEKLHSSSGVVAIDDDAQQP
jgi:hypothetical protein